METKNVRVFFTLLVSSGTTTSCCGRVSRVCFGVLLTCCRKIDCFQKNVFNLSGENNFSQWFEMLSSELCKKQHLKLWLHINRKTVCCSKWSRNCECAGISCRTRCPRWAEEQCWRRTCHSQFCYFSWQVYYSTNLRTNCLCVNVTNSGVSFDCFVQLFVQPFFAIRAEKLFACFGWNQIFMLNCGKKKEMHVDRGHVVRVSWP